MPVLEALLAEMTPPEGCGTDATSGDNAGEVGFFCICVNRLIYSNIELCTSHVCRDEVKICHSCQMHACMQLSLSLKVLLYK